MNIKNIKITKRKATAGIVILASLFAWKLHPGDFHAKTGARENSARVAGESAANLEAGFHFEPGPVSMEALKTKGCVADGLLSGYGKDTDEEAAMIERSNCVYLHRALETWGETPDFQKALDIMEKIKKPGLVYGMFLAEDLKKNEDYYYPDEDRNFDFSKMCREGTDNRWGEHTCIPDLASGEYRKYLSYITHRAMDLGIQSFLFGQVYYQDQSIPDDTNISEVVSDMRAYAKERGLDIVIGAQTNTITDKKYLSHFDYIEGGVGIGNDGQIENGPCWSQLQSCWALLWNDRYAKNAKNVFLHLDWSGLNFDDMSSFARMDEGGRATVLNTLYKYFKSKDMGFMMPMMATLDKDNGGCHGPKKRLYSASDDYTCKDEGVINSILSKS